MKEQLLANIRTNLKFYARNGILWIVFLIMLMQAGLCFLIPSLLSTSGKFDTIQAITQNFSGYFSIIAAILGILAISHHIRSRCLKMVFTRPCSPDMWLLALYLSIALVAAVLFLSIFFTVSLLFLVWKIPFQAGCIYIIFCNFFRAMLFSFCLLFLGIFLHPALAVFFVLSFNESSLYWILVFIAGVIRNSVSSTKVFFLTLAERALYLVYMILPLNPYQKELESITRSWLLYGKDWLRLGITLLYTLSVSALLFFFSSAILKKKRLI